MTLQRITIKTIKNYEQLLVQSNYNKKRLKKCETRGYVNEKGENTKIKKVKTKNMLYINSLCKICNFKQKNRHSNTLFQHNHPRPPLLRVTNYVYAF